MELKLTSAMIGRWRQIMMTLLLVVGFILTPTAQAGVASKSLPILIKGIAKVGNKAGKALIKEAAEKSPTIARQAGKLMGYAARWIIILYHKDFSKWTGEQIRTTLYNPEENKQLIIPKVKEVANDWHEIENGMDKKLGRPVTGNAENNGMPNSPTTTNAPDGLDKKQ